MKEVLEQQLAEKPARVFNMPYQISTVTFKSFEDDF